MRRLLVASKSCRSICPADELVDRFASAGFDADLSNLADSMDHLSDYEAIVIGTERIGEDVFVNVGDKLALICKFGVGLDAINRDACARHGVAVRNLPAVNSEAVAEMALGLMLSLARRVTAGDRAVRAGIWPRLVGTSLGGKTLGILGTGAIGSALARLASCFDVRLTGYDIIQNACFIAQGGTYSTLDEVLTQSDFVSIHLPLLPATRNFIGARELGIMKPTAYLINTARGGIVNEEDLYKALVSGGIAGAGLDVLAAEPPFSSPLVALDNVICTPHIAASDDGTLNTMLDACIHVLTEFFEEKR